MLNMQYPDALGRKRFRDGRASVNRQVRDTPNLSTVPAGRVGG
jgi:hypothetical protein